MASADGPPRPPASRDGRSVPSVSVRHRQILDAAKGLFYERGFEGVGVDEIGQAAGITGPAIYRHFSGKDEILATLFDAAMDQLLMLAGSPLPDPREDLRQLARGHAEFALNDRALLSIYAREERALTPDHRRRLHRRQRQYVERWVTALERCVPSRDPDQIEAMTYAMIGMLLSVAQWPRDVLATEGLAELMVELIDRVVEPALAPAEPDP